MSMIGDTGSGLPCDQSTRSLEMIGTRDGSIITPSLSQQEGRKSEELDPKELAWWTTGYKLHEAFQQKVPNMRVVMFAKRLTPAQFEKADDDCRGPDDHGGAIGRYNEAVNFKEYQLGEKVVEGKAMEVLTWPAYKKRN